MGILQVAFSYVTSLLEIIDWARLESIDPIEND